MLKRALPGAIGLLLCAALTNVAFAAKQYGPGASDTEIRIGNTMPYSGPASVYSAEGIMQMGYFKMLNETKGGVNGRKITLLSLDDGYSPPKTFEQVRKLVEQEKVLGIFGSLGTPTGLSVRNYLNQKKVPQMLQLSNSSQWNKPHQYPWSTSLNLAADQESAALAKWLLSTKPDAKIGIIYQNDDFGKDYAAGFVKGLGDKSAQVVKQVGYEATDSNADSQVLELKSSGADVVVVAATAKFAALTIRKIADMQWKPLEILSTGANSLSAVLKVAGTQNAVGAITVASYKDVADPTTANDKDVQDYVAFVKKYAPNINPGDSFSVLGYVSAEVTAKILEGAGDNLTRENILKVATHLNITSLPMLANGVTIKTSPTSYLPFHEIVIQRFDGTAWRSFGKPIPAPEQSPAG
ncbi:MAG: ABC transporter substrate-binding protein [Janthinobacterium lividum]